MTNDDDFPGEPTWMDDAAAAATNAAAEADLAVVIEAAAEADLVARIDAEMRKRREWEPVGEDPDFVLRTAAIERLRERHRRLQRVMAAARRLVAFRAPYGSSLFVPLVDDLRDALEMESSE